MKQKLQRRFALSSKGADDTIRGSLFCALQNVAFMLPAVSYTHLTLPTNSRV